MQKRSFRALLLGSLEASRRTLALPFFPQLETEDQERVVEALRAAL